MLRFLLALAFTFLVPFLLYHGSLMLVPHLGIAAEPHSAAMVIAVVPSMISIIIGIRIAAGLRKAAKSTKPK